MIAKKLVRRDEASRSHVYEAALSEERTQRQLVRDLLDRAFGGSAAKLVMQALATKRASAAELAEVRNLIDAMK
jgi:predicted transcriptional regulator